ncbi:SRPBCC domain-containing protein [Echinicola jeungdonensis]|uniref:SRPBCC domain-containing protein n=1 Tax=Echinicola jeungdonensis TaxID=709343 RepID=A0ABV5J393_9BACT|nr:SRPBCC domain-containing protein [Echinicola jeungdonensis]MDN3670561.1 SRPBCC domain-containing protein [Echinicola jeungdonensis]
MEDSYHITHICHTDASQKAVFKALSTIKGLSHWWTAQTHGNPGMDGTIVFQFGNSFKDEVHVTDFELDKRIEWTVLDSVPDWIGTIISFDLDQHEGKTRIRLTHKGFKQQDDYFAQCNFSWAKYLISLRNLVENGQGDPYDDHKPFD